MTGQTRLFRQRQFWDLSHIDNPTFERLFSFYIQRMDKIERVLVACILISDHDMSIAFNDKPVGLIEAYAVCQPCE